jgi:hypothetical protein
MHCSSSRFHSYNTSYHKLWNQGKNKAEDSVKTQRHWILVGVRKNWTGHVMHHIIVQDQSKRNFQMLRPFQVCLTPVKGRCGT